MEGADVIIDPGLINLLLILVALLGFIAVPLASAVFVATVILLSTLMASIAVPQNSMAR